MAQRKTKKKQAKEKSDIASERVSILFKLADEAALSGDLDGADEYVKQARRIAMKFNLRIPKECKRQFCKYCYCYLLPSVTSQVRLNSKEHQVEVKCLKCMRVSVYPFVHEVKERRKKSKTTP